MHAVPAPTSVHEPAGLWCRIQDRVTCLAAEAAWQGSAPVAAVPGARAHDLLTHLVVTSERRVAGQDVLPLASVAADLAGDTTDAPVSGLLARWAAVTDEVARLLGSGTGDGPDLVVGALMHEHDIRMALERPGFRDSDEIRYALDVLAAGFSRRVTDRGLPALRVTVEQWGTIIGSGNPRDCVVADRYEFVRALAGRRSASEIRRWNWSGEPDPWLAAIPSTGEPREAELHERDPRVPAHMRDREFLLSAADPNF